jgi:hypothetical protein
MVMRYVHRDKAPLYQYLGFPLRVLRTIGESKQRVQSQTTALAISSASPMRTPS